MSTVAVEENEVDQDREEFKQLLQEYGAQLPKVGDMVEGEVIGIGKNEVQIDINGIASGIVRGYELIDESEEYSHLALGDKVVATVLDLENESGAMELSFRSAGHKKAWDRLFDLINAGDIVQAQITEANKGGLMVVLGKTKGFLPVSQLCPEHYPRIQGGDKNKILDRLKTYVGQMFDVKVIDVNEKEEKLIVSEKSVWEERQKDVIGSYKVGDEIEGTITVITDFGAFVEFGEGLEGLVHISELAWQRIDDPRDVVARGQKIKAQIIKIDGSKIFLSMKNLIDDPWKHVVEKYTLGQKVQGKVLKINPFGLFVELDTDIHGLAHVSELSEKPDVNPYDVAKPGDELEFRIVSIKPDEHRLGLSINAMNKPDSYFTEKTEATQEDESSDPHSTGSTLEQTPKGSTEETTTPIVE
ncbi:MAG: S1 RNA-binding domain-containing protein [bacterium]|nr:S1 RNA-binding domain-containing protein [bacterium]